MSLQIQNETQDGVSILAIAGEVDLGSAPPLREALAPILDGEKPRLLLDLTGVHFMDSTGIGVMVNALNRVREKSGTCAFCGVQPRVHRILQIAGLLKALPLYENRESALEALQESLNEVPQ
jgi:anti-sigma B factor antagonist